MHCLYGHIKRENKMDYEYKDMVYSQFLYFGLYGANGANTYSMILPASMFVWIYHHIYIMARECFSFLSKWAEESCRNLENSSRTALSLLWYLPFRNTYAQLCKRRARGANVRPRTRRSEFALVRNLKPKAF